MNRKWKQRIVNFLSSEDGPSSVEYAILLALIVGMMVSAITYVGEQTQEIADTTLGALESALK